jgi:hypothetical protein
MDKSIGSHFSGPVGANMANILEAPISFSDSATALGIIPDGAKIYSITIIVTTAFTTGASYSVGYAADDDAIISAVSLGTVTGLVGTNAPAATAAQWGNGVTSGVLIGKTTGTSIIAGAGKIRIVYYF